MNAENEKHNLMSKSLQAFLDAFGDAQPDLKWIRDEFRFRYEMETGSMNSFGNHVDTTNRFKRNRNSEKFTKKVAKDNGDTWYNDFRKEECRSGNSFDKSFCKDVDGDKMRKEDELMVNEMRKKIEIDSAKNYGFTERPVEAKNFDFHSSNFDSSRIEAQFNARKYLAQDKLSLDSIESNWRRPSFAVNTQSLRNTANSNISRQLDYNLDEHLIKRRSIVNSIDFLQNYPDYGGVDGSLGE